jgi:hypothetical protein
MYGPPGRESSAEWGPTRAAGGNWKGWLDERSGELYHRAAEVGASPFWVRGKLSGGAGSALRGPGTVRGAGLVRSEPETLSFCLLLKLRTICNIRNFKSINELE